jgi:hypothetical protein
MVTKTKNKKQKKTGRMGGILLYNSYFPQRKTIDENLVFINKRGDIHALDMCS